MGSTALGFLEAGAETVPWDVGPGVFACGVDPGLMVVFPVLDGLGVTGGDDFLTVSAGGSVFDLIASMIIDFFVHASQHPPASMIPTIITVRARCMIHGRLTLWLMALRVSMICCLESSSRGRSDSVSSFFRAFNMELNSRSPPFIVAAG